MFQIQPLRLLGIYYRCIELFDMPLAECVSSDLDCPVNLIPKIWAGVCQRGDECSGAAELL